MSMDVVKIATLHPIQHISYIIRMRTTMLSKVIGMDRFGVIFQAIRATTQVDGEIDPIIWVWMTDDRIAGLLMNEREKDNHLKLILHPRRF